MEDVVGDDDINEDEWDCVMAAVGLTQPHSNIAASPPVLRNAHACALDLVGISTAYDNTEGQHSIRDERGGKTEKPNFSCNTSLRADANSHCWHMAFTADNKDIASASRPAENNKCIKMRGKSTFDGEVNGCFGRRAACDDQEEIDRHTQCKRRRLRA